jgi:hypothetical protein
MWNARVRLIMDTITWFAMSVTAEKLNGRMFFIIELLAGQPVGLKEITDGLWQLQFSFYALGSIDLRKNKIIRN